MLDEKTLFSTVSAKIVSPYPPVSPALVEATEAQLGFTLPHLLKRFYLEIGNGGYGPQDSSLLGLEGGGSIYGETLATLYATDRETPQEFPFRYRMEGQIYNQWPEKLLCVFCWPCMIYTCLDCREEQAPVYLFDTNATGWCLQTQEPVPLLRQAGSFAEWLSLWAEEGDYWEPMDALVKAEIARIEKAK